MGNKTKEKGGVVSSLDGLVECPICGEPRKEFSKSRMLSVEKEYVGVEACNWCGSTFLTSTLDGETERSPKAPNSSISGK